LWKRRSNQAYARSGTQEAVGDDETEFATGGRGDTDASGKGEGCLGFGAAAKGGER
jgi:hypothetical protein